MNRHDTFLSPLADEAVDSFGDLADEQAWALHETEAILVGERPERTEARLCTRGAPHSCGEGGASPSRRQLVGGARMLVQGLETQAHINGSIGTVVSRASGSADGRVDLALGPPHSKSISIRCQHLRPSRSEARGGMPTIAAPGGGGDGSALWVISPAERAAGEGRAAEAPSNPPRRVAVSCISVLPQPEHGGSA